MTIVHKKVSVGQFLKKGEDFKDGDMLEVANEGKEVQGEWGMQNLFLVKVNGKDGNVNFNQMTMNGMVDAFGEETKNWIGKQIKAWKIKQSVAGKFLDVWYFSHPDADLTENGFILSSSTASGTTGKFANVDIPILEDDGEEEEVNVNEIPF